MNSAATSCDGGGALTLSGMTRLAEDAAQPRPASSDCPCGLDGGAVHVCTWAQPRAAAVIAGRPLQTVLTWQKRGLITSMCGVDRKIWVCLCETICQSDATFTRWRRRADRVLARNCAA